MPSIILKINVKLGGSNFTWDSYKTPFLTNASVMILGADITHPSPGDLNKPSISALVGSIESTFCSYISTTRAQTARLEHIQELKNMFLELVKSFKLKNGFYPQRILFYRDGVSVGKYKDTALKEMEYLKEACKELKIEMSITFVIVQKRHHVKFFGLNKEDLDKSGNLSSGTVVDTHITDPNEFNFFLISHAGLQGTSRPRFFFFFINFY